MMRSVPPTRRSAPRIRIIGLLILVVLLAGGGLAAAPPQAPEGVAAPSDAAPPPAATEAPAEDATSPEEEGDGTERDVAEAPDEAGAPDGDPADEEPVVPEAEGDPGRTEDGAGSGSTREAQVDFAVEANELRALRGDEVVWTLPLPIEGGPTSTRLVEEERIAVAHGLYLLEIDREDGRILRRIPLPAPGLEIESRAEGYRVEVAFTTGTTRTVDVPGDDEEPVRFDVQPAAFGWLQAGARASESPAEASERDETNPWLAFYAAVATDDEDERDALFDGAVARAGQLPFFESANLALALAEQGETARAEAAMEAALEDFGRRDYDPRLLTDRDLREAYGFPLETVREAIERGDVETLELWAPYVWRLASEEAPETLEALDDLSRELREADRRDAADLWRDRAADLRRAGLATWLDRVALSLGRFGWWGVAALLAAFALAWIVLLAKVWRAQSLARMQRRERAEPVRPVSRIWVPRQASTTEKLSLVLILVLVGFMTALTAWASQARDAGAALRSGTLAHVPAVEALADLPDTPYAHFARGVSHHVRGEAAPAEEAYRRAGERAPALTNLGLLTDDDALLQAALRVDPRQEVARYHLGRAPHPSPFHEVYGADRPLLAVPSQLELALASGGDWRAALQEAAVAPWRALPAARPAGLPAVAWWALLIAYALLLLALIVQLFVPRPRVARHAPRTPAYHPLALLIPGSGHLDELWGLLLLIPWSIVGMDALLQVLGYEGALSLSLTTEAWILALLWLANVVGFTVEAASYRRRIRLLRERKPELARSYGLPPRPTKTEA